MRQFIYPATIAVDTAGFHLVTFPDVPEAGTDLDGIGSTRALTDESGNVTDQYVYDAFGRLITQSGTTDNLYLFQGEQFDSNLDQYYLRARFYDLTTVENQNKAVVRLRSADRATHYPALSVPIEGKTDSYISEGAWKV